MKLRIWGLLIGIVLFTTAAPGLLQAADLPVVQIAIVRDGPWTRYPAAVERFRQEITALTENQFDIRFVTGRDMDGDWTPQGIRGSLEHALSDPAIDLVIALGHVASDIACRMGALSKPVIAPFVIDAQTQHLPNKEGTTGVPNLNYINRMKSVDRDVQAFRGIVDFKHLAVLVDGYILRAMPQFIKEIRKIGHAFTVGLTIVAVEASARDAIANLPPDTDAVMVGGLFRIDAEGFKSMVTELSLRRLPSYSFWGRDEVELGILATMTPAGTLDHLARSVAVNVLDVLTGENAGDLRVAFSMDEQMTINMATARATGVYPSLRILTEADLLHEERQDVERTLTLETALREALVANLDLVAAERGVAAGDAAVGQARSNLLPQLDVGTDAGMIDSDRARAGGGSAPERTWTASANVSQVIYSEKAWSAYTIEKHLQDARLSDRDALQLDIFQSAALAYVNVLRAQALERIQKENLRLTRANLQRARVRLTVGAAGPDEVYRWESQIASDRRAVLDAESVTLVRMNRLNRILHRPLDEAFVLTDVEGDALLFEGERWQFSDLVDNTRNLQVLSRFLIQEGTADAPELKQLKALIEARERLLKAAQREFWMPTLAVQGSVSELLAESGQGQRGDALLALDDTDWRVGVRASLPIFSGGRKTATLRRTREELAQLQAQHDAAGERITQRILAAVNRSRSSSPGVRLSRHAAQTARRNLKLVTDSYARGIKSIIDLLDAQNLVLVADQQAANARYDYVADIITIQRAVGQFGMMMDTEAREAYIEKLKNYLKAAGIDPERL